MSPLNPLNPATGDVPDPEDPKEIDAALRAGRISLRVFPYLVWRYGGRGKKFTQSDSAWLVWLTRYDPEHVHAQIQWLCSVLSNRGMPSWILESHLAVLNRQLTRTIPESKKNYASLLTSARRLREAREGQIPPQRDARLIADFHAAMRHKPCALVAGAARLITAAVADEKLGIKNAVSSLEGWMMDPSHWQRRTDIRATIGQGARTILDSKGFAAQWQSAVAALIANARGQSR